MFFKAKLFFVLLFHIRCRFLRLVRIGYFHRTEHGASKWMILMLFGPEVCQQVLPFGELSRTNRAPVRFTMLVLQHVDVTGLFSFESHAADFTSILGRKVHSAQMCSHVSCHDVAELAFLQLVFFAFFSLQNGVIFFPFFGCHIILIFDVLFLVVPVSQFGAEFLWTVTARKHLGRMVRIDMVLNGG